MEERVEGRMKGSEGERWVTPSPALRTRGIRTSGMIRHSVAFRAEQQRETSRPLQLHRGLLPWRNKTLVRMVW